MRSGSSGKCGAPAPSVALVVPPERMTVTFVTAAGRLVESEPLSRLLKLQVGTFRLSRPVKSKPRAGQRLVPVQGRYWFSQTGRLVVFESILEMLNLMLLDHRERVVAVVAQPFLLEGICKHFPDFYVELESGERLVIDVKPAAKLGKPQVAAAFEMTRQACAALGWRYEVRSELPGALADNLRVLSHFRQPLPFDEEPYAQALLDHCAAEPRTFGFLRDAVGPRPFVQPVLFRLLWQRRLHADLQSAVLDVHTLITEARP